MTLRTALQTRYDNVLRYTGSTTPPLHAALLDSLATSVRNGAISFDAAASQVIALAINTTAVASISYQFFTGLGLRQSGLDYLVSPLSPNAHHLNSAYYQAFSLENRYINFSVNLGRYGEAKDSFAASYGALSMEQTVAKAYEAIFGTAASQAKVNALINDLVPNGQGGTQTRVEYFAKYGLDGVNGVGTKAALIGWLLAEAAKANIGPYVAANTAFLQDLSADGQAAFYTDLLSTYGPDLSVGAGALITVGMAKNVSPEATDPMLRSTPKNDVISGTALNAVQSVIAGAGNDTIAITGAVGGVIDAGNGADIISIGTLKSPITVLGVTENAIVRAGAGNDTITVTTRLENGAVIDGGAGDDTLILNLSGDPATPVLTSIEHLVIETATEFQRSMIAPTDLKDFVIKADEGFTFGIIGSGVRVTLQDVSGGVIELVHQVDVIPGRFAQFVGADFSDIHLDHVTTGSGVPTELRLSSLAGDVRLHVDSDSVLSKIGSPNVSTIYPSGNVIIDGPGVLTSAFDDYTKSIDASASGGVHLTKVSGGAGGTFILSAHADSFAVDLVSGGYLGITKFTLGDGSDTFTLYQNGVSQPRFGNMYVSDGAAVTGYASIIDFQKGVDHVDLGAEVTVLTALSEFVGSATSLESALVNVSSHLGANETGVFEYGGATWIYHQDGTVGANSGDGLIQLVGVTGLSAGMGSEDIIFN